MPLVSNFAKLTSPERKKLKPPNCAEPGFVFRVNELQNVLFSAAP